LMYGVYFITHAHILINTQIHHSYTLTNTYFQTYTLINTCQHSTNINQHTQQEYFVVCWLYECDKCWYTLHITLINNHTHNTLIQEKLCCLYVFIECVLMKVYVRMFWHTLSLLYKCSCVCVAWYAEVKNV